MAKLIYNFGDALKAINKSFIDISFNNVTALHCAAENGDLKMVKNLIQQGADITRTTKDGWTSLMIATYYGHINIVKYLIQMSDLKENNESDYAKSFRNVANGNGYNALDIALLQSDYKIARILIDNGQYAIANTSQKRNCLRTLVHRGDFIGVEFYLHYTNEVITRRKRNYTKRG